MAVRGRGLEGAADEIKKLIREDGGDGVIVRFEVTDADPLSLDEISGDEQLDEGDADFDIGAWVDYFRETFTLAEGDVVVCGKTQDGWIALEVEADAGTSTAWHNLSFGGGISTEWQPSATVPARYRTIGDQVYLEGHADATTTYTFPSEILTMPEGARPPKERRFLLPQVDAAGGLSESIEVRIGTDGKVVAFQGVTGSAVSRTTGSVQSLDGVTFGAA